MLFALWAFRLRFALLCVVLDYDFVVYFRTQVTMTDLSPSSVADDRMSSLLSSSEFSVASYLNLALSNESSAGNAEELQRRMAELALQLQIQTQSCHEDIGRIGAELQAILPRCAADVGRVGVGLQGMKVDAQTLMESTAVDEKEEALSGSLETLSTLHALQSNLSRAKEILTAAATWDSTIASIPPLLANQNLAEAVDALALLENGERALHGMPAGKEERQASLKKIRNQVQVMLSPQLKHALTNMNSRLAPLQQCVALYSKLDKMDLLREEYVKNRPGEIHKAWFNFVPSVNIDNADVTKKNDEFATWLPSWYDAILSLLAEERRQSSSVFGPESAPEILVMVLKECFRPILSSFASRLENIFSSSTTTSSQSQQGQGSRGSFETVCAAYESTLRFLSLSYELITAAFFDVAESSSSSSENNGALLYRQMLQVFQLVAKHFSPYMQKFDSLEYYHLTTTTILVNKDIQQSCASVSLSGDALSTLRAATECLKDLAPLIFKETSSSLDRFELMNGGYRVGESLAAIDKILTSHVGELSMAIKSLSAAISHDKNKLSEVFDEQYVLCSMELLKLAGTFKRTLSDFESSTRDRLTILVERIMAHSSLDREIRESLSNRKKSKFSLPDSLSVIEIDLVFVKEFCGQEHNKNDEEEEDTAALAMLSRLATTQIGDHPSMLYPKTQDSLNRLSNSCHSFVFHVCSAVPHQHLSTLSEMDAWRKPSNDEMDSYGTLPQSYINQVGEHMLSLVQAFEPFSEDTETLALANEVMDGVQDVAIQPWDEFVASSGIVSFNEELVNSLMSGHSVSPLVLQNAVLSEEDAAFEGGMSDSEKNSAIFCNKWLNVIGLAVTAKLLERIMRISQLTPKGCEHLTADLNYLVNVFSALGIAGHPHPLVSHLAALVMLSDQELKSHIASRDRNGDPVTTAIRAVEARIALVRGVSIN